jgi:integrase/recombinase XerD
MAVLPGESFGALPFVFLLFIFPELRRSSPVRLLPEDYSGARNDEHLVELWLNGRPHETQRAYRREAHAFLRAIPAGLRDATVADLVAWVGTLEGKPSTQGRRIAAVKSLLAYAHRTGYTVFNVGMAVRCPKLPSKLHERIVEEEVVLASLGVDGSPRDTALVRFLYASGARISEAVGLRFKDLSGQRVTLNGKGAKTRTIVVPEPVVAELQALRLPDDDDTAPVFKNYRGGQLSDRYARKIVKRMAGEVGSVLSPHWLRHAHASHALDRGAPIHLVKESLGHANVASTSRYLHARPNQGSGQFLPLPVVVE